MHKSWIGGFCIPTEAAAGTTLLPVSLQQSKGSLQWRKILLEQQCLAFCQAPSCGQTLAKSQVTLLANSETASCLCTGT